MSDEYLGALLGSGLRGVVFEGTGLGHINSKNIEVVKKFIRDGGVVCMTSQCLWGRVDMNVYDTGRDLLKAGVVPLEDMLPETALAKLMWALANCKSADETKAVMQENLAGEMTAADGPEEVASPGETGTRHDPPLRPRSVPAQGRTGDPPAAGDEHQALLSVPHREVRRAPTLVREEAPPDPERARADRPGGGLRVQQGEGQPLQVEPRVRRAWSRRTRSPPTLRTRRRSRRPS